MAELTAKDVMTRNVITVRDDATLSELVATLTEHMITGAPVVDEKGHLRHEGGVVDAPGMYAIGLPVLRRRKSTFIHGAEDDAREVTDHLAGYLARRC